MNSKDYSKKSVLNFNWVDSGEIKEKTSKEQKNIIYKKQADLNDKQFQMIRGLVESKIYLNPKKNHKMEIKILDNETFQITFDSESTFFIHKKKIESVNEQYTIIESQIKKRTLFSTIKKIFQGFLHLGYKPFFPDPSIKQREYGDIVKQDYRAVRKALESGYSWLSAKKKVRVTSKESKQKTVLKKIVKSCVANTKDIEKAINSRNPNRAIDKLSERYARKLMDLNSGESLTLPTGYVNREKALQPIMLRFYRDKNKDLHLEIYSDTTEAGAKISPRVIKKFTGDQTVEHTKALLNTALSPLIRPKINIKALQQASKPNQLWEILFKAKAKEKGLQFQEKEATGQAPLKTRMEKLPGSLSYEIFVRTLETTMEKKEKSFWKDVTPKNQKLIRQPDTPAARVTKWFSHLLGEEYTFSKDEKLNLLFDLTVEWVEDRVKQASKKLSSQRQLAIYEETYESLEHILTKLAVAINENHPILPEIGVPQAILKLKERCCEKIESLRGAVRQQKVSATGEHLDKAHKKRVEIPIAIKKFKEQTPAKKAGVGTVVNIAHQGLEKTDTERAINMSALSELFSAEMMREHQRKQIILQLGSVAARVAKSLKKEGKQITLCDAKSIVNVLFPNGEFAPEGLKTVVSQLLIKTGFAEQVVKGTDARYLEKIETEEFIQAIQELIVCPHLNPVDESRNKKTFFREIIARLRRIADPNVAIPENSLEAFRAFRAILSLRNIIPRDNPAFRNAIKSKAASYETRVLNDLEVSINEELSSIDKKLNTIDLEKGKRELEFTLKVQKDICIAQQKALKTDPSLQGQIDAVKNTLQTINQDQADTAGSLEGVKNYIKGKKLKSLIEHKNYFEFLAQGQKGDGVDELQALFPKISSPPLKDFEVANVETDIQKMNQTVIDHLKGFNKNIRDLKGAAKGKNLSQKRTINEYIKLHASEILKILPPPGTEGSMGTPSFWSSLTKAERIDVLKEVHYLEHALWESHLKLAQGSMEGKQRFLLVKAGTIRQTIVRTIVADTQLAFRELIAQHYKKTGQIPDKLKTIVVENKEKSTLDFFWNKVTGDTFKSLAELVKESEVNDPFLFPGYLFLDKWTMDTERGNQLLVQDLTTCLSENAEMEKDLLAVYHFIIKDQNKGFQEKIDIPEDPQERDGQFKRGRIRIPFFHDVSREIHILDYADSSFEFDVSNSVPEYDQGWFKAQIENVENDTFYELLEQMKKSHYFFHSASDPNFTLFSDSPLLGVPFFQSHPTAFLEQENLNVSISGYEAKVVGDEEEKIANIMTEGHKDFSYRPLDADRYTKTEKQLRMRKRKPALPVVDNDPENKNPQLADIRTHKPFEVWLEYVQKRSEEEVLSIPPQALQKLFQIRQAAGDKRNKFSSSSYSSDTAVNAQSFLASAENQTYLQHDFVQQFIEESLFGPFLMQQAIIDHPDLVLQMITLLVERMAEAKDAKNLEVVAFLTHVVSQVQRHAHFAQKELNAQGWFSGLIHGSLPIHLGKSGGAYGEILRITEKCNPANSAASNHPVFGGKSTESVDPEQAVHPLIGQIKMINRLVETLSEINEEIKDKEGEFNLLRLYFDEEDGSRYIDNITNLERKKQAYALCLQRYKDDIAVNDLTEKDVENILFGYRFLADSHIAGGIATQNGDLVNWVRSSILPKFKTFEKGLKGEMLTALFNQELAQNKEELIQGKNWEHVEGTVSTYRLKRIGKTDITIDLMTLETTGAALIKRGGDKVFLPASLFKNFEVQQALKKERIKADKTLDASGVHYRWKESGQAFSITENGGDIVIKRTIKTEPWQGTYTFSPVATKEFGHAGKLLSTHGLWLKEGDEGKGYVFSEGTSQPQEKRVYIGDIQQKEGRTVVVGVRAYNGNFISSSTAKAPQSPVLFANADNVMTLIDDKKKACEMRLMRTELNFQRRENEWVCFLGSNELGRLKSPEADEEKRLVEHFGENWDQYVIPLEKEHPQRNGVSERQYVMIPYVQSAEEKGKMIVDHDSLKDVGSVEVLTMNSDGSIGATLAAQLYLAHRFVAQAAQIKNSSAARKLLMQAQSHLDQVKNERPSSNPKELESLKGIMQIISDHPALFAENAPSPEAMAVALRLSLFVRRLRKMSLNQGIRTLHLSAVENFSEMDAISKLYEAYCVMEQQKAFSIFKPEREMLAHKSLQKLDEREKSELTEIGRGALRATVRAQKSMEDYFGTTGRLATKLEMEQPQSLDPKFSLALIRMAKSVDPTIRIQDVKAPMPLNTLLENFWSYFVSIKEDNVTPEQLLFLYEESTLPPGKSIEEENALKAVDKQARQFLIAFSNVQRKLGRNFKSLDFAKKAVDDAKKEMRAYTEEGSLFTEILEQIQPDLKEKFLGIRDSVANIQVERVSKKIGNETIDYPDVEKLLRQAKEIEVKTVIFADKLRDIVDQGKQLIERHTKETDKLLDQIRGLEQEKERLDQDKEADDRLGIEKSLQELNARLKDVRKKKVTDPISGEEFSISQIVNGSYAEAVNFVQLEKAAQLAIRLKEKLEKSIKDIGIMTAEFDQFLQLQEVFSSLSAANFKPSPWFDLPEKGAAKDLVKQEFAAPEREQVSKLRAGWSALKQLGVKKTVKLAREIAEAKRLEKKIEIVKKQPNEEDKLNEIKKKYHGTLIGKMELFAVPLGAMVAIANQNKNAEGIVIKGKPKGIEAPLSVIDLLEGLQISECFTEEEMEKIQVGLQNMNTMAQNSALHELSRVLQRTQTIVAAQTGLGKNTETINTIFETQFKRSIPKKKVSIPNVKNLTKPSALQQEIAPFYSESVDGVGKKLEELKDSENKRKGFLTSLNAFIEKPGSAHNPVDELNKQLQIANELFSPYSDALNQIRSFPNEEVKADFLKKANQTKNWEELLLFISKTNDKLAHLSFVNELIDTTLPDDKSALISQDLKKGFENLKENDPLAFSTVISENRIEEVEGKVNQEVENLRSSINRQEKEILHRLKAISIPRLPKSLQRIRLQGGTDQKLLEEAKNEYRKGFFAPEEFRPGNVANLFKDRSLDELIGGFQIDQTRLSSLRGGGNDALRSIQKLYSLREKRKEQKKVLEENRYSDLKDPRFGRTNDLPKFYVLTGDDGSRRTVPKAPIIDAERRLAAIDASWKLECNKIKDLTERCQSTNHLENLSERLRPHARKMIYIQQRLGYVLRQNQIDVLEKIIENPSLLIQLRMGLGKTSVIVPFALEILASERHFPIGMVPKALFDTNFKEMDEATRLVFELAGNQFLFDRQDAPEPFSLSTLHMISQKCSDFFSALKRGEFVLTTIESKASLDDKISELERSQSRVIQEINLLKEEKEIEDTSIKRLYEKSVRHQIVLDQLIRVKSAFENENTRIIIDEIDQVARASYAVNSEIGAKEIPDQILRDTVTTLFDLIREEKKLKGLREEIFSNNQFTLTTEQVDKYIKSIGQIYLERNKNGLPRDMQNDLTPILNWFAGKKSPFENAIVANLEKSFFTQLKAMRRGLNSALRGALRCKIGLSGDWDPTHAAVGVPASQGVTSKTTKYNDPLMQLCLTNLITMYKPQGEPFLKSAAADVLNAMQSRLKEVDQRLKELKKRDEKTQILERNQLESEKNRLEKGIETLTDLLEKEQKGEKPVFREALKGRKKQIVFLRQKFGEQVALRKLIYVSENQISRPVQHALRGCNVIGLTGTATRNTEHVIKSRGHEAGMEEIEKGRETTAEVLCRLVKNLPDGLQSPVKTYPSDAKEAEKLFIKLASKNSEYDVLINQAGVCDHLSMQQIVAILHGSAKRPIICMNMTPEGSYKSVFIDGEFKKIDDMRSADAKRIQENAFYYYHTPHVRGTHHSIPTGSRAALLLSPTVNADDRDQAAFRPRQLGEGHIEDLFISEKQHKALADDDPNNVTLARVFKAHHEQTVNDAEKEDLAAFQLHIQGLLLRGAERALAELQTALPAKKIGNWFSEADMERYLFEISTKSKVFTLFERLFIQISGNRAYQKLLDMEIYRGGEIPTKEHIKKLITEEINKADHLLHLLQKELNKNLLSAKPIGIAIRHISSQRQLLVEEMQKLESSWKKLKKQFPKSCMYSQSIDETAETEAEEEAQEEQETTTESTAQQNRRLRNTATRSVVSEIDHELLGEIEADFKGAYLTQNRYHRLGSSNKVKAITACWKNNALVSDRLKRQLKGCIGGAMPDMKLIIVSKNGKKTIVAVDAEEGNSSTHPNAFFYHEGAKNKSASRHQLASAFTIQPIYEANGDLQLVYAGTAPLMKEMSQDFEEDVKLQAEILLTLIYLGIARLNEDQWFILQSYWKELEKGAKEEIKKAFESQIGGKNPAFLKKLGDHLWNKTEQIIVLGQEVVNREKRKITDIEEAKEKFEKEFTGKEPDFGKKFERWKNDNIESEELQEKFDLWGEDEYDALRS